MYMAWRSAGRLRTAPGRRQSAHSCACASVRTKYALVAFRSRGSGRRASPGRTPDFFCSRNCERGPGRGALVGSVAAA